MGSFMEHMIGGLAGIGRIFSINGLVFLFHALIKPAESN